MSRALEASADIEEAYQCYEAQQAGLGEEFLFAVDVVSKPSWQIRFHFR